MNEKLLPDKPSELLRLAIADLRSVAKDSRYRVAMSEWHNPTLGRSACYVCLAGAVMATTLGVNIFQYAVPGTFCSANAHKLNWLNDIRIINPYNYDTHPDGFIAWLEGYAYVLAEQEINI